MELKYHRCGDYLLPDLSLTEEEQKPVGKYGMMRIHSILQRRQIPGALWIQVTGRSTRSSIGMHRTGTVSDSGKSPHSEIQIKVHGF